MCLAIPAKVIRLEGDSALVSIEGVEYNASLLLMQDVREGDYVLLHAGFAIEKLDAQEASRTLDLLREMAEAGSIQNIPGDA